MRICFNIRVSDFLRSSHCAFFSQVLEAGDDVVGYVGLNDHSILAVETETNG